MASVSPPLKRLRRLSDVLQTAPPSGAQFVHEAANSDVQPVWQALSKVCESSSSLLAPTQYPRHGGTALEELEEIARIDASGAYSHPGPHALASRASNVSLASDIRAGLSAFSVASPGFAVSSATSAGSIASGTRQAPAPASVASAAPCMRRESARVSDASLFSGASGIPAGAGSRPLFANTASFVASDIAAGSIGSHAAPVANGKEKTQGTSHWGPDFFNAQGTSHLGLLNAMERRGTHHQHDITVATTAVPSGSGDATSSRTQVAAPRDVRQSLSTQEARELDWKGIAQAKARVFLSQHHPRPRKQHVSSSHVRQMCNSGSESGRLSMVMAMPTQRVVDVPDASVSTGQLVSTVSADVEMHTAQQPFSREVARESLSAAGNVGTSLLKRRPRLVISKIEHSGSISELCPGEPSRTALRDPQQIVSGLQMRPDEHSRPSIGKPHRVESAFAEHSRTMGTVVHPVSAEDVMVPSSVRAQTFLMRQASKRSIGWQTEAVPAVLPCAPVQESSEHMVSTSFLPVARCDLGPAEMDVCSSDSDAPIQRSVSSAQPICERVQRYASVVSIGSESTDGQPADAEGEERGSPGTPPTPVVRRRFSRLRRSSGLQLARRAEAAGIAPKTQPAVGRGCLAQVELELPREQDASVAGGVYIQVRPKGRQPLRFAGAGALSAQALEAARAFEIGSKVQVVFTETGTFSRELPAVAEVRLASEVPKLKHKVPKRRSLGRKTEPQHDIALVIKKHWLDRILSGEKTWEIRGTRTNVRRVVRLAQSGSGLLMGEARVTNCFPLALEDMPSHVAKHCVHDLSIVKYRTIFAWELQDAQRFAEPMPYKHPIGAITWVKLGAHQATAEDQPDDDSLPLTELLAEATPEDPVDDDSLPLTELRAEGDSRMLSEAAKRPPTAAEGRMQKMKERLAKRGVMGAAAAEG